MATEPPVTISSSSDSDMEIGHEPEAPKLSDAAAVWMTENQAIDVGVYWNDVVRMLDFDDHLDETETYKLMQSYRDKVRPQWVKPPRMNKSRWWREMFILCIRDAESKAAFDRVFPATVADELIPIRSWALQDPEAFKAFIDSDPEARALVESMPVVDAAPRVFSPYSLGRLRESDLVRKSLFSSPCMLYQRRTRDAGVVKDTLALIKQTIAEQQSAFDADKLKAITREEIEEAVGDAWFSNRNADYIMREVYRSKS